MIIAHLPAGYLLAKLSRSRGILFAGIVAGSILPDLDMLWFHFVDHGQTHHHHYLTHRPLLWTIALLIGVVLRFPLVIGVGIGAIFHLILDSIAGQVSWGWPFWEGATTLVVVPATHDHWIKSFMAHWTFMVELAIAATAVIVLLFSIRKRRQYAPEKATD